MLPLCLAPYLYISLSLIFCCTIQRFFPKVVYLNAIDLICTQLNHIYTNYLHYCAYSCCVQIVHTFKKQSTHFNIDNWRYMNVHNLVLIRVTYSQLGGVLFNIRIKHVKYTIIFELFLIHQLIFVLIVLNGLITLVVSKNYCHL